MEIITFNGVRSGFHWKDIWRKEVALKIIIFLWRACHKWLPTMVSIAKRKVSMDGFCPECKNMYETTFHAIWGCLA